jgi:hypothetical protein
VVPNCVGLPPSDPRNCVSKNTITADTNVVPNCVGLPPSDPRNCDVNVASMSRFTTSMVVGEDAVKVIHESLRGAAVESPAVESAVVDPSQKIGVIHDVDGCPGTTKRCRCGTSVWCSNYCICDPLPPTA